MFTNLLMMIGTTELLLVAGIALLLFGGKKLPEMMKGMGEGVKSFKDAVNGNGGEAREKEQEDTDTPTSQHVEPEQKDSLKEDDNGC